MGLTFGGELVAVAQFSRPATAKKKKEYSWELVRLCFKEGLRVMGGASRLLRCFIRTYAPEDFFTYQDSTGEATKVYALAGMVFVSQAKKKTYLVAPGKSLSEAQRGEYYSIGEIARRGPDALLGTKLGEVFVDGVRLTNPKIFTDILGWNAVSTVGDRVYEWVNPDRTYYTYKITASDSGKYYFGVSHVKQAEATAEACLTHQYLGSGGAKFQNWKNKHEEKLQKEILRVFPSRGKALAHERKLVNRATLGDPKCLNSEYGGERYLSHRGKYQEGRCEIHGLVILRAGHCVNCVAKRRVDKSLCSTHGETLHWVSSKKCLRCAGEKAISTMNCSKHGETKFRGAQCFKCSIPETKEGNCEQHGKSPHRGGLCQRCKNSGNITTKWCEAHGELTVHQLDKCYRCKTEKLIEHKVCYRHGLTKHIGEKCHRCSTEAQMVQTGLCSKHGPVNFQHGECGKCKTKSSISVKECPKHGLVKHRGDTCYTCRAEKRFTTKVCLRHGEVKHSGNSCIPCSSEKGHQKRRKQ